MKRKSLLSVFALFGIVSLSWAQNTIVNDNSSWATLSYGLTPACYRLDRTFKNPSSKAEENKGIRLEIICISLTTKVVG
ncbi:MAG: hypothetical protein FWG84_10465 [Bacteroidales bacterium]|nr:hypothetical protein [Bacteroidales bacterium]